MRKTWKLIMKLNERSKRRGVLTGSDQEDKERGNTPWNRLRGTFVTGAARRDKSTGWDKYLSRRASASGRVDTDTTTTPAVDSVILSIAQYYAGWGRGSRPYTLVRANTLNL